MGQPFVGFTSDSFGFFRELAQNNNKAWFDQNRERYDRHVVGAFRGLLEALQPFLLKLNPHFETGGKTGRNFSRINRDIRFSKDKSPYKPNYYLYIFNRSREPQSDGRLYVGLSAECITRWIRLLCLLEAGQEERARNDFSQETSIALPKTQRTAAWCCPQGAIPDLLAPRRGEGLGSPSWSATQQK
jgi:uncharacterized protein (TIGR02453 family)